MEDQEINLKKMSADTGKFEHLANKAQKGEEKKYLISSNVINVQLNTHKLNELLNWPVFELTELTNWREQC